jgi:1-acyl-sn-glycerol-3-phosphate acyltransferase
MSTKKIKKADPQYEMKQMLDGHRIIRWLSSNIFGFLANIIFRITYEGVEYMPKSGPALLVGNHTSLIDIPAIHCVLKPWVHWVAKKELFEKPFIGWFFKLNGNIAVDRDKVDLQAARGIFGALSAGRIVAMFPQATRVEPERVLLHLPRTGVAHFAIKTGAPIIPVAIDGKFSMFRKNRVVFGPAFKLDADPRKRYNNAELMTFTIEIMQKVYDLIGIDYHLADSALMSEGFVRRADGTLAEQTNSEKAATALLGGFKV